LHEVKYIEVKGLYLSYNQVSLKKERFFAKTGVKSKLKTNIKR